MRGRLALSILSGGLLSWGCCDRDAPTPEGAESSEPVSSARPPRCALVGKEKNLGGTKSAGDENLDKVLPFAAEVGHGVSFDGGFAIGTLRQEDKKTLASVVTVGLDGTSFDEVALGSLHGDVGPPQVFARGKVLGAAVLEPSGASRTLRLAHIQNKEVSWTAELLQGVDESLAFDVALGERRGVVVWDDVPKKREVSAIHRSLFNPVSLSDPTRPGVLTLPGTDAELPRLLPRPGGFWLFWVARRPSKEKHDARYRAEDIDHRWIEVVPLDEDGALVGSPRKVGSVDGYVLAYDVARAARDAAVVMWRDDDTPSGSPGGRLYRAVVRLGGIDGPDVVSDDRLGIGAPNVMPGWLAIADASGPTRLTPMGSDGNLLDILVSEPLLGAGEPLANADDKLLISRPAGVDVRLFVVKCSRAVVDGGAGDGGEHEE